MTSILLHLATAAVTYAFTAAKPKEEEVPAYGPSHRFPRHVLTVLLPTDTNSDREFLESLVKDGWVVNEGSIDEFLAKGMPVSFTTKDEDIAFSLTFIGTKTSQAGVSAGNNNSVAIATAPMNNGCQQGITEAIENLYKLIDKL